jgi:ComF family protein
LLWQVLDLVFPPECPGCQKLDVRWCEECQNSLSHIQKPFCPVCGEPGKTEEICQDCLNTPPWFDQLRSVALFDGPIRKALHHLKYRNDIGLGEVLAHHLFDLFIEQGWEVDLVTSVPLGRKRNRQRGYNQAEILAKPFAGLANIPYNKRVIQRLKETRSQVDLSIQERMENVSGAFYANSMYCEQKSVIIIDDVTTTGSTISECARSLKQSGARQVYAMTLARAPLHFS